MCLTELSDLSKAVVLVKGWASCWWTCKSFHISCHLKNMNSLCVWQNPPNVRLIVERWIRNHWHSIYEIWQFQKSILVSINKKIVQSTQWGMLAIYLPSVYVLMTFYLLKSISCNDPWLPESIASSLYSRKTHDPPSFFSKLKYGTSTWRRGDEVTGQQHDILAAEIYSLCLHACVWRSELLKGSLKVNGSVMQNIINTMLLPFVCSSDEGLISSFPASRSLTNTECNVIICKPPSRTQRGRAFTHNNLHWKQTSFITGSRMQDICLFYASPLSDPRWGFIILKLIPALGTLFIQLTDVAL